MMSDEGNVTVVTQPVSHTNITVVTEAPPSPVPVVTTTTSPALKFQYPLLQPLGVLTFPQGIAEIVLRTVICVRKAPSLHYM